MSSQARRMRRYQERQMVKAVRKARQAPAPAPSPAEASADERLARQGIQLQRSLLWTPPGA